MNMKHHPSEAERLTKLNTMSHSTTATKTPPRFRPNAKTKPSPSPKQESVFPDLKTNATAANTRRSLVLNRPKSSDDALRSQILDEAKVLGRSVNRPVVEQFARPRRPRITDSCSAKNSEDGVVNKVKKELEEKLSLSENLVKDLQAEVLALKTELDKAQSLNAELEKQKNKITGDLVAAQAKIAALSSPEQRESTGESQSRKFKDIQKLIANKLEHSIVRKDVIKETSSIKPPSGPKCSVPKAVDAETKVSAHHLLLAPPPPPPPPRPPVRAAAPRKASSFVQLYHSLTKQEGKKELMRPQNYNKPAVCSAHSSIVGEIQNRSAHLLAIKADIETKGDFINGLIQKVLAAAYTDIEDVLKFVDWLDAELSSLADEQAVLKHFKWPERKADAMREAAIEYRELKLLESEILSYKDDLNIPCGAALKKMASLLDKSERSIQRLIKLRNSVMHSYQDCKIPVDWMLDSGIVSKIKRASMKLAQVYMKRVTMEFESVRNSDRESSQEALLLQGVHFAYRAHQLAGGLDSETLCAFEEIRQRVPRHLGGCQQLLAGIPS